VQLLTSSNRFRYYIDIHQYMRDKAMIRRATPDDLPAITAIYNDAILHTTATMDTEPKTVTEQERWFGQHDETYPVLVVLREGSVVGWASISRWSDRCAYADTGEVSLYVDARARGQGIGTELMQALIETAQANGLHTLLARIAGDNAVSVRLHERFGFVLVGTMQEVGEKFGKKLDVHLMQRMLHG
jgi:phosphinothricin acetyltransferase